MMAILKKLEFIHGRYFAVIDFGDKEINMMEVHDSYNQIFTEVVNHSSVTSAKEEEL